MTAPAHPQREYIIDEYTLDEIERLLNMPEHAWDESDYDAQTTALKLIRSRPHSSVQSRDQVLDDVVLAFLEKSEVNCSEKTGQITALGNWGIDEIMAILQSLRTQGSRDP